ncbi:MAG: TonB-dependent receptor [Gammaproteobacteria bacterium]|nr:TonB-dependent receptor [Gammaproteobacteria bacterium]
MVKGVFAVLHNRVIGLPVSELRRAAAAILLLPIGTAGPALAQETGHAAEQRTVLEELVVTAQKREQDIQDVAIAMSVLSGEQLRSFGVQSSYDIAAITPGVHIGGAYGGQNQLYTIRGVTQVDFNDIVEAPVAVYLDEGYIAIAQAQSFGLFDIDRVEVLKGPQGTLFGRNATGGLVHFVSRQPSFDSADGYIDVGWGRFDTPTDANQYRVEAAIGGPLSDTVAARAAILWNRQDPLLQNLYPLGAVGGAPGAGAGADQGNDDTVAGRLTLLFQPSDRLSMRLSANAARSRLTTGPYQSKPTIAVFEQVGAGLEIVDTRDVTPGESRASIGPGGVDLGTDLNNDAVFGGPGEFYGRPVAGGDFFGFVTPSAASNLISVDFAFDDASSTDTLGLNWKLDWNISDHVRLTAITDYKDYEKLFLMDVDAAPTNQSVNYAGVDADSLTQELRLQGGARGPAWVGGLYYVRIDTTSLNGLKFPSGSVVPGAPFDLGSDATLRTDSYSLFGQLERDLGEHLTLLFGARVIREEKDYRFTQSLYFTQNSLQVHQGAPLLIGPRYDQFGAPQPFVDSTSDTLWAGNAQVNWKPNADLLYYAAVKRGIKAGSFNAQLAGGISVPDSAIPYSEEVLTSYEVGFKSTLAGGRARFNGNVFYYDYKDYQAFLFTGVSGVVLNADARYYGADFDLQFSPVSGLDLILGASWIDATVKDLPLRVGGPLIRDVQPTYTPELQFMAMARYEWPAFGGYLSVSGDVSWSDSFYYNLRNFAADQFDSYYLLNLQFGWQSEDGAWQATLAGRNMTDERAGNVGFSLATLCGCNEVAYRAPRWIGMTVRRSF